MREHFRGQVEYFRCRHNARRTADPLAEQVVPMVGFEPTRVAPPPPQDGVSTNSTTSAIVSAFTRLN